MAISIDRLKDVPLFRDLSQSEIESVLSLTREVSWDEGQTICTEGETGETIYIIYSGSIKVSKRLTLLQPGQESDLSDKVLMKMDAADPIILGEVAMLTRPERSATITATRKCDGLEMFGRDLASLCQTRPDLGFKIMHNLASILSERLRAANRDVARLATALTVALG
jgi:CRP/FNR family cyclic AMP-dependent transcriptional regulator